MTKRDYIILIQDYVSRILNFEANLKDEYSLIDHPYNELKKIPKTNVLTTANGEWSYHFHGIGCIFQQKETIVRYSIYVNQENYIVTSPFDFLEFINSLDEQYSSLGITMEEVVTAFDEVAEQGMVKKIFDDYFVYEISINWYYSSL